MSASEVTDEPAAAAGEPVVVKKYANRRLYDTSASAYVTLDDLAEMVKRGVDFVVFDAKTNEDITRQVLTQIIMEEESRGETLLPVGFLRQLIGMYGGQGPAALPQFLEASMDAFQQGQSQLRDALAGAFTANPFAELARRNMEMFQAAARQGQPAPPAAREPAAGEGEVERLRAELAALQAKVDKLAK